MGGRRRPKQPARPRADPKEHPVHRHIGHFGGGIDHHEVPVHEPAEDEGVQDAFEHFFGAIGNLVDALGDALDKDSDQVTAE